MVTDHDKTGLSDSDNMLLQQEAEEIRHRRWALDKLQKVLKWSAAALLGAVAVADAVGRIFSKVSEWLKP